MKDGLLSYLDKEDELARRNQEADEAWQEYQRTGMSVSNEAMMGWLDTWGTDKEGPCPEIES